jgi:hypothetical protein
MCFHGSGMATPSVDVVSGAASTFAGSAVSRAYEACHTRHAPTCLTSDKARYGNFRGRASLTLPLGIATCAILSPKLPESALRYMR